MTNTTASSPTRKKPRPAPWPGPIVVYRYTALPRFDGETVDLDDHALEQLKLAHTARNRFVDLWLAEEAARAELWLTRMEVAEIAAHLEDAERTAGQLRDEIGRKRAAGRTRTPDKDLAARLRTANNTAKQLRVEFRHAKTAAQDALKPRLDALAEHSRAARKALYRQCTREGLFWGTFNAIEKDMAIAVGQVAKTRKAGLPAQLRHEAWTGEGFLAVQLQLGDSPRSPAAIEDGVPTWHNTLRIEPANPTVRRPGQHTERVRIISIKTGTNPDMTPILQRVPVIWHRDLPTDSEITNVELIRRRTAGTHRLAVCFTVRIPPLPPVTRTATCGVDIGWRAMPDGSIRVAVWHGRPTTPITAPPTFEHAVIIRPDGGEVRIPATWIHGTGKGRGAYGWRKIDDLSSIKGKNLDRLQANLLELWDTDPSLADLTGTSRADIARWRAPHRFVTLTRTVLETPELSDSQTAAVLAAWRKQDRHLWEWREHQARKLANRRRHLYREIGARLARSYGVIALEEAFSSTVRRRPDRDQPDDHQAQHARRNARLAAPYEFVVAVTNACARAGVKIDKRNPANSTRPHYGCGGMFDPDELRDKIEVRCPDCHELVDQDENAAKNLAAATNTTSPLQATDGSA